MTAYTSSFLQPTSEAAREAREKRRKVLEAAEQTRKANYHRFLPVYGIPRKDAQREKPPIASKR
jgi:hypothetical protein